MNLRELPSDLDEFAVLIDYEMVRESVDEVLSC